MKKLFVLICFSHFLMSNLSARDSTGVFRERANTELEKARAQIRTHMIEHSCQLSMWAGQAGGVDVCSNVVKKLKDDEKVDVDQLITDIKKVAEEDISMRPEIKEGFIKKIALYVQAQVATLEQIDIKGLEESGRQLDAWDALILLNRNFHLNWHKIELAMGDSVPKEARNMFAKKEKQFSKDLPQLKPKKLSSPESDVSKVDRVHGNNHRQLTKDEEESRERIRRGY